MNFPKDVVVDNGTAELLLRYYSYIPDSGGGGKARGMKEKNLFVRAATCALPRVADIYKTTRIASDYCC